MLGLGLGTSKGGFVDALAEVTNTKSIIFDGGDEYVQFNDLDIVTDNFTISGWAKPTDASDFQVIMSKWDDGTSANSVFRIVLSGGVCICALKKTGGSTLATSTTTTTLTDGLWFHFAFTNDGSNLKGYINGVLQDTDSTTSGDLNTSDQNFLLGGQYNGASVVNEFEGNLDEIAIWNEALTQAEITQIYNTNKATLDLSTDTFDYSSSANLKMWLRMGDEASTRVVDDNANNLVIPDMRKTFFTGKSIDFDGTNDYVKVGSQSFTDDSDFSISLWFKSSDTTKQTPLLTSPVDSTGNWSLKMKTSGKVTFSFSDGSNSINSQDDGLTCSDGQWHHIVMTVDRSNGCAHRRYIDGGTATVRGSTAVTGDLDTGNFYYIGAVNGSGNQDNFATAQICDVAIFNTVLDADTVASIYNSGEPNNLLLSASYTAGSGVDKTANLQAYYRMGNGSIDAFSNSSQTGIGLIADYTNATLGTALVPNLSDDGNGNGSNWTLTALAEWTINTNTATAFEATTDSDISGSADAKLYVKASNSGLSADIPAGVYKITGTLSTTSTLPSTNCRFVWYGGYSTNIHNLSAGNFEIYELCTSSSNNHHFQFQTSTEGHNFKLENVKFEPVNGNAGITINMSAFDVVDHAPNRNSGDMINFDGSDIETDTPVQIYTVANTKSVLFDGTDDFINIGSQTSSDPLCLSGSDGTISAWIKIPDVSDGDGSKRIIDKSDSTSGANGNDGYSLYVGTDGTVASAINGSAILSTSSGVITDNTWFHIVWKWDGSNHYIYVNGSQSATASSSAQPPSDTEDLRIGAWSQNSDRDFAGNIDEVAIWNEALTASEVAQIYHAGQANFDLSQNGGGYTSASNLQAWWRMGDGTIDDFPLIGDQTNTTLGSELFNGTNKGVNLFTSVGGGTEVSFEYSSGEWIMTGNGGDSIGLMYLSDKSDNGGLSQDLEANTLYKITFDAKRNAVGATSIQVIGANTTTHSLTTNYESYTTILKADASPSDTDHYIRGISIANNEAVYIKNISVKKINGNAGLMTNMASSAIETDTP